MSLEAPLAVLRRGVDVWNQWRLDHPGESPVLAHAFLPGLFEPATGAKGKARPLRKGTRTSLRGINFSTTNLAQANLEGVDLDGADLRGANLDGAYLKRASLAGARLDGAFLQDVNLRSANLRDASLRGVDLRRAVLVDADFSGADLTDCNVFGVAAWNVRLSPETNQSRLIVQDYNATAFVVPGLDLAQFVYMLTQPGGLRGMLGAMITNGVLLLGRFTPERKAVLDQLRDQLWQEKHIPLMFDFEPLHERNLAETVVVLAGMSRLVIADLGEARALPFELTTLVRTLKVPVIFTLPDSTPLDSLTTMWNDVTENDWVSAKVFRYRSAEDLLAQLPDLLAEAAQLALSLQNRREQRRLVPAALHPSRRPAAP